LREEIEKRVLRILINSGLISLLMMALVYLEVSFPYILVAVSKEGFTLTMAIGMLGLIVLFFLALRVILDLTKVIDAASASLLKHMPGFNPEKGSSIIRALKELALVFAIAMIVSIVTPLISAVAAGGWIGLVLSLTCLVLALALMYDAGKTLYTAFESSIQLLIDKLTSSNDKSG